MPKQAANKDTSMMPGQHESQQSTESGLVITLEGKKYTILQSEITGVEVKDFREAVGVSPMRFFADPRNLDLDIVAGFIWLVRRRKERALQYDDIASKINYGSQLEFDAAAAGSVSEDDDPEV